MSREREPVPYMVAVAHMLRRIEAIPCREPVPLVVLTEKPVEAEVIAAPILAQPRHLRPGERIVKSVANGEWVVVWQPSR